MMKKRHVHDLSNYNWCSMRAGEVTPIKVTEVLPNDSVELSTESIIRLDALDAPTMHPLKVKIFHFFSPNRQVWSPWNDFIKQGNNGVSTAVPPYLNVGSGETQIGYLLNRLGLPQVNAGRPTPEKVNALPIAHYWNIIDNYFTDDQIDSLPSFLLSDGNNTGTFHPSLYLPYSAAWKKDYFSTCRLEPQAGGAVPIPQSNVVSNGLSPEYSGATQTDKKLVSTVVGTPRLDLDGGATATENLHYGSETGLEMDESAVMRDLSVAGALQIFRENRNGWSRIIDYLRGAFGSKISSYELAEPVLLNYGEKTIRFSEVLQTAEGTDPVGTLRGHGIGGMGTNKSRYTVPEHGYIITLAYVMPEPAYLTSAERFWFKETFTDYFQPEFEAIGQTAVLDKEIAFGVAGNNDGIFGYNDPYDDYRRALNTVSGTFATTDKNWHMARDFAGLVPALDSTFLHSPPTQRIFSDTTGEVYKLFSYNKMVARRVVKRKVTKRIL